MNFWYEVISDGIRNGYISRVAECFDSRRKKHIFIYDFEGNKGKKEFLKLDPLTKEIEWIDESLKEDDEVKCAIRDFKNSVFFVNGNNDKAKEWLRTEINYFVEIGFSNEIIISVNGKNIGADRIFWIVKRTFTLDDNERINSEPLIVVRGEANPESKHYEYQDSGKEYELYKNKEGVFLHNEIFNALWEDISKLEPEIYNIGLDYRHTIDYRRYV